MKEDVALQRKTRKTKFWSTPLVLLAKSAKLVKLFKLVKLLKFTKIIVTLFTMVLSALVYSFTLGPWFAIGLVIMLFVHEMGHIIALRLKGYPASAPIFIPMVGAVIFAPKFKNAEEEAYVGYGGPFVGGLAALAVIALWAILPQKHEILLLIGYSATFMNLFNMLPIRPLDGGRVTHIIGSWFKWVGFAGMIWLTLLVKEPSILLIWILVLQDFDIQPLFKFGTGLSCLIGMALLMITGHSDQKWWVDLLDIILGTFFVWTMYAQMKWNFIEKEERVEAPLNTRMKWFALYALLLISLYALMAAQIPYLPQHLQK